MKTLKIYVQLLSIMLVLSSCQKVIDLKLDNEAGQLVIEGNITNLNGVQTIKLSQNVPFSSTNTYPPVSGAKVSVTDANGRTYAFTESAAGSYTISRMSGTTGNTYTMHVSLNGTTYQASSKMPAQVPLDSVTASDQQFNNNDRHKKVITVYYKDPAGVANQYRFVMFKNGVQIKTVFANDDQFTDGRKVAVDLRPDDDDDEDAIYPGDHITIEMQCIDRPVYTYWYTLLQQGQGGPGGSVTPSNPPTNITPTVLGYFSAHTTQTLTLLVQ